MASEGWWLGAKGGGEGVRGGLTQTDKMLKLGAGFGWGGEEGRGLESSKEGYTEKARGQREEI